MADDKKDKLETEETAVAEEGPVAEETAEAAADAVESEPVDGDETEGAAASEIGDAAAPSEGDSDKVEDEPVDEETSDTTDEPEPDTTEVADEPGEVDEELVEDEPDEVDKEPVDDEKPVDKPVAKATAVKSEKAPESLSGGTPKKDGFLAKKIGMPVGLALAAGGLVVGLLVGNAVFGSGASAKFAGKSSISEAELDAPIAVVNYKGKKIDVSARDIITTSSTLTSAKLEDGTYDLPSAEFVLTTARDKVLEIEAEARGVSVSEEDLKAKSLETLGTDDISAVATTYGMDEETIRAAMKSQCIQDKMREQSGSEMEMPEPPTAPDSPAKGSESTATADYAKYIIGLAGDAWDAKAGKWADPESTWATSLTEEAGFTSSKATYEAASMAYSLAYTDFVEKQTAYSDVWQKLSDDIYSNASVSISTLIQ